MCMNIISTSVAAETYVGTGGLADTAWPKFHANLNNTGQSPYNGPQSNNVIWTYNTGNYIFYSSPVVGSDGTIYIGSYDNNIYALDTDGTLKWKYATGDKIYGSAAIGADGTIYIGSGDCFLYALNPEGTLKWSYNTGGSIESSPTIGADGIIYIGSNDNKLYALNPDGTLKWSYTTGGKIQGSAAIGADGTIYIGSGDYFLYALNPEGTLKWSYNTGNAIFDSPAIATDGTIYVGSENNILSALSPDGTLKWSYTTGGWLRSSPSIGADGTICIGSNDNKLYALNPDGTLKWSYNTGNTICSSAAIGVDGTIYVGSESKRLSALNPDGTLKWSYTTGGWIRSSPAIGVDGTLYIGSRDKKVYAFQDVATVAPVSNFTSKVTKGTEGYIPLTVQFTDTSLNRPTSWYWDFGDGSTSTKKNPSHTYTIPGTYTISLNVTNNIGSDDEVKTDYITVTTPTTMYSDLTTESATFATTYPLTNNTFNVTVTNSGEENAASFNVTVQIGGISKTVNIPELASGNNTTISIKDIKREVGSSVKVNVKIDPENSIIETDETNNEYTTNAIITASGERYEGGRFSDGYDKVNTAVYEKGNIGVRVLEYGGYTWFTHTGTATYSAKDLNIPSNATIKSARLYQAWTWYADPHFTVEFNGHKSQNPDVIYTDKITGNYVFDVTPYFSAGSNNTAVITAENDQRGYYGTVLVVVYEDVSEPYRQIWVNEGCDCLLYGTEDPYVGYTIINNVSTAGLLSANVTAVLPSGENADLKISLNQKSFSMTRSDKPDPSFHYYDVTDAVKDGTNELGVKGHGGDYFNYALSIVEMTKLTASEANFTSNVTGGNAPLNVKFTDTSTGTPTNWTWDFGDGSTSTEQNPIYIYKSEGTYTVKLTVSNSLGSDSEEKTGYITVGSAVLAPVSNFSSNVTKGNAPLSVQFKDESTNSPTSWEWNFGDGKTSAEQTPSHTYETVGTYTVNLTAMNYGGSNSTTKTDYITVTSDTSAPVASFTSDANSGQVPFTVKFTDTSTGKVSSWNWDFGDGSTSKEQNPTHTYVAAGSYTVTLTATGPGGSNTATSGKPITVSASLTSPSYNGGIPLATAQNGTVSGGLWCDSYPGFSTSAQKTFTLPDYTKIKWARLYVTVYDGHMENNYRGNVSIDIDANGDSKYEIQKTENFDTTYSFPGTGGIGPVWLSDHMNRVTSDYLMWYDLTDSIEGQKVNVQATTTKVDSSFDGRVKAMTLVVAYDDGDSDQVYYWVNQGHDTVNPLDDTYTGSTAFGTSSLEKGWSSANLTAIFLASVDGTYSFQGTKLVSGTKSGLYYGFNTWDISSLLTAEQDSKLDYNKQESNYYKIPLALMSVKYTSASPELPTADFKADVTGGNAPLSVNFTDQSTGNISSYSWDFDNDGNVDSTEQNPVHIYNAAGNYTVNLTVSNADGSDAEVKTDYIVVSEPLPGAPVADFAATPTSGTTPLTVSFKDQSTGTVSSYAWDFDNDGNVDSTEQSPSYTYITTGTYTVNLTVTGPGGSDSEVKTGYVKVTGSSPGKPVAAFSASPASGKTPLTVAFTDKSSNMPTKWKWSFGDGASSTIQNPKHKYFKAGKYTVTLTVTNAKGSNTATETDYIKVIEKPVANFNSSITSGKVPLNVKFTDTSTGTPVTWKWTFGDGTSSTVQNPIHKYSKAGVYTVSLTVKNAAGSNTVTKTEHIKVTAKPAANFTSSVTSGKASLNVKFTDTSTGTPATWKWTFGDGTSSTVQNPTHKYSKSGTYTVSLTVKNAAGSNTVTKTDYIKVTEKPVAEFSATPTSGKMPLTVAFTDTSTGLPTKWKWNFGDGTSSTIQNPKHKYSKAGSYTVTLTATNAAGSSITTKTDYIKVTTNTK
jgi:PKD repeat protein